MVRFAGILIAGALAAAPACATQTPDWSFGGTFGVLGMGPQLAVRTAFLGAHVDGAFSEFDGHVGAHSARYNSRLSMMSAGMMIDIFPFGGQLHFSAGARYAASSGFVRAAPGQMTMAGAGDPITGKTDTQRLTPAISLGLGSSRPESRLSWRVEAGLMARGGVKLSKLISGARIAPDRLALERADLQGQLGRYFLFPTAQFELGWKF